MPTTLPLRLPRRLSVLGAALLPLAFAGAAGADTVLVLKAHQDASVVAGQEQPARDGTVELWIGDGRASRSDDLGRFVLLPDEVAIVNHADRTYTVLELPVDFQKLMPPGMQQSAEMWKLEAKVTPGEERRKIGDWNTRRYTIELTNAMGLAVRTEMWTTTELGFDLEVYHRLARQICTKYRNAEGELYVVAFDPALEDRIRAGFEHTERGLFIRMSPQAVEATCRGIVEQIEKLTTTGHTPIVLVSPQIRAAVKRLTENHLPNLVVLSFNEVTRDTKIVTVGIVSDGG